LIMEYYPDYEDIINHWELRENKITEFFKHKFEFVSYENNISNNFQAFIGRTLSHSFSNDNEDFITGLKEFFDDYSTNGTLYVPNDTIAYIGTIEHINSVGKE